MNKFDGYMGRQWRSICVSAPLFQREFNIVDDVLVVKTINLQAFNVAKTKLD